MATQRLTNPDNVEVNPEPNLKDAHNDITLRRNLGMFAAMSMVAGGMIGSGIFVSARWVLVYSGSVGMTMMVWLVCGVLVFFGGMCWVELGLTFPKCGGEYILIKSTLGDLPAFATIWLKLLLVGPSSSAIKALTFASYAMEVIFPGCGDRKDLIPLQKIIAASAICLLILVNILSSKHAAVVQIVFTVAKFSALFMIIITGFVRIGQGSTSSFSNSFQGTTTQIGVLGLAAQASLWAYEGWDSLNDISEEVIKPKRTMPWAILGSIFSVMCVYVLVNLAYLTVLGQEEMKRSPATAMLFASHVYGPMAWIIPFCVACSVFGSMNSGYFKGGRITFAAARESHLPSFLAMIHRSKQTPILALMFWNILACAMIIPDRTTVRSLISIFSFAEWFTYTLTVTGLLWTRYKRPNLPRPFKLPIIIPILFLIICLWLAITPIIEAPYESALSFVGVIVGIPVYYIFVRFRLTPKCVLDLLDRFTYKVQEVLSVVYPKAADQIIFDE